MSEGELKDRIKSLNSLKKLYKKEERLGVGAFQEVRRYVKRHRFWYLLASSKDRYPEVLAVKKVQLTTVSGVDIDREREILDDIAHHDNIVKLYVSFKDEECLYLCMEHCHTNLHEFAKKKNPSLEEIRIICLQILKGLKHLHDGDIVHRDLKPRNILVKYTTNTAADYLIKIADFGLSRYIEMSKDSPSITSVGTKKYMAPEVARKSAVDKEFRGDAKKADVFSAGVTCFELATGQLPFTVEELVTNTKGKDLHKVTRIVNDTELPGLLIPMLEWNPDDRCDAGKALQIISAIVFSDKWPPSTMQELTGMFEPSKKLGRGSFGNVRQYDRRIKGPESIMHFPRNIAVKEIDKAKLDLKKEMRELNLGPTLKHDNIVLIYSAFEEPDALYICMELCQVNLKELIKSRSYSRAISSRSQENLKICRDTLRGLSYLHEQDLAHRDMKPDNILIHRSKDGTLTAKISDFGLSRYIPPTEIYSLTAVGTKMYMAPEVAIAHHHAVSFKGDPKLADVFSTGVVFFELSIGRTPFTFDELLKGNAPPNLGQKCELLPLKIKEVATIMLQWLPKDRMKTEALLPYLR